MNKILDILSITGSFLIVFGLLFLLQDYTIGLFRFWDNLIVFKIIYFKDLLFTATSLLFILKFIDFYRPNRKQKNNCCEHAV
jgi:hypothetical protein